MNKEELALRLAEIGSELEMARMPLHLFTKADGVAKASTDFVRAARSTPTAKVVKAKGSKSVKKKLLPVVRKGIKGAKSRAKELVSPENFGSTLVDKTVDFGVGAGGTASIFAYQKARKEVKNREKKLKNRLKKFTSKIIPSSKPASKESYSNDLVKVANFLLEAKTIGQGNPRKGGPLVRPVQMTAQGHRDPTNPQQVAEHKIINRK